MNRSLIKIEQTKGGAPVSHLVIPMKIGIQFENPSAAELLFSAENLEEPKEKGEWATAHSPEIQVLVRILIRIPP
jgi:hypothetical protein